MSPRPTEQQIDYGDEIIGWQVPEYEKHERPKSWYVIASIVVILLLTYSFWTANFLFAVIIIVTSLVIILHDGREPDMVHFSITDEGIIIGRKFYDFDEIKDFSVVYKPKQGVKNLYFEFKNAIKHRLSIPLQDMNPLLIRENLLWQRC
jgi:hypothetical protein